MVLIGARHSHVTMAALASVAAALGLLAACSTAEEDLPGPTSAAASAENVIEVQDRCDPGSALAFDRRLSIESDVYGSPQLFTVHVSTCRVSDGPLPIVYLMHGAGADDTQWADVGLFAAADRAIEVGELRSLILVAPDAASAYPCLDCAETLTRHLLDELEPVVASMVDVDRANRGIAGISRGGGLALGVMAYEPASFAAVAAHSSILVSDDVLQALTVADVVVHLDVGRDDRLLSATIDMAERLTQLGASVLVDVGDGAHDRSYWRSRADSYIDLYGSWFETPR